MSESISFAQKAVDVLKDYCEYEYGGSVNAMIDGLKIEVGNGVVHKWFRGVAMPQLKVIGPFLDKIGADIIGPRDVKKLSLLKALPPNDTALQDDIVALRQQNAELQQQLTLAQGEIRALERQLARMMPAPGHLSEKISPSSSRETHGSSVKAG